MLVIKYFSLILAILTSLLWVNQIIIDFINAKINPYGSGDNTEFDVKGAKIKFILIISTSFFWGTYIYF